MIDGKNVFDQPINSKLKTYGNIRKIASGKRDDFTAVYLLDYSYFKENYKMSAIDLSKQQVIDADTRTNGQINVTENTTMIFIIKEAKEVVLAFSQGTVKFLWMQLSWPQLRWIIQLLSI